MRKFLQNSFALTEKGASELLKAVVATVIVNLLLMGVSGISFFYIKDTLMPVLQNEQPVYEILIYIGYSVFMFIILTLFYYIQYNFCYVSAYEESANLRLSLAESLRKLPLSFFGKKDLSDLTATVMGDVSMIENAFSHFIPNFLGSIISTIILGIGAFIFDARLAISLVWVIPVSFFLCIATKKIQESNVVKTNTSKIICLDKIQECIENIKDIKSNNRSQAHLEIMNDLLDKNEKVMLKSELIMGTLVTISQMILKVGIATTMLVGATLLATGEIALITFLAFLMIASRIYDPLSGALVNLAAIYISLKSVDRMNEFNSTKIQSGAEIMNPQGYDVSFEDVHFSYDSSETVLNGISFVAKQGEITALVGPSGGGKTTAMKLAARFWDIDQGKIMIGNEDISKIDPETLLKEISIVFQDVTLFNNTVMENIRIGKKNASDEEVIIAAKDAMCHDFIMKMPNGYDTLIGENGANLSGGERQRLSIARALLKDSPIVLLDEATSSLDIKNESLVQKAISRLTKDKTVIVIAHRMRTISGANKIVLLNGGKVSKQGKHHELLKISKEYENMINLQTESANWVLS